MIKTIIDDDVILGINPTKISDMYYGNEADSYTEEKNRMALKIRLDTAALFIPRLNFVEVREIINFLNNPDEMVFVIEREE